jgi:hypothetical protein
MLDKNKGLSRIPDGSLAIIQGTHNFGPGSFEVEVKFI